MSILVTGAAGFIGFHVSKRLLEEGHSVIGLDNLNDYYDVSLKKSRLNEIEHKKFNFINCDLQNIDNLSQIFKKNKIKKIINLAAQAGVRYSITNPQAYIDSNIHGFLNILECARNFRIEHLVYASSSSVYGMNETLPFSVSDNVDHPVSLYAASKKSNELIAYTYNHLYGLNTTGLRFFTVYGPWGRPDMAMYIFADKIRNKEKIPVFNRGKMKRDFTYIDDIISGIRSSLEKNYHCEIFNLGNNRCEDLMNMINYMQLEFGSKVDFEFLDMQPGDVTETFANIDHAKNKLNYNPKISIKEGIPKFICWYKSYYQL